MKGAVFVVVLSILTFSESADTTLRLVNLVYRHGDRSPVTLFPKDINQLDKWPDGLGWLTKEGMMMHYKLGQWLRNRYDGFLNKTFIHTEIEVASSNEDRCLMSAYCNLAGLYPPATTQLWNPKLFWQPIPVHTRPKKEDNVINMGENCPRYDQLYQETLNTPEIKQEEIRNKDFYKYIGQVAGVDHENISNIWRIADTLLCEKAHNLTIVKWADEQWKNENMTVYQKLRYLDDWQFRLMFSGQEKSKLKGGPILGEFVQNMVSASKQKKIQPKLFMYSGHDTTVAALLSALNLYSNGTSPPYAATVIVELHQDPQRKYYVNIFYKNTTETAYPLTLPGCTTNCMLEDFQRITKPYIPVDWIKECSVTTTSDKSVLTLYQLTTIILSGLILFLIIVSVLLFCRVRKLKVPYNNFR